jgi:hypothetical protein
MRFTLLFFFVAGAPLAGCSAMHERVEGPASYTSSTDAPGASGALVQRALVCTRKDHRLVLQLSPACTLHGIWGATGRHTSSAIFDAGQTCDLPTAAGPIPVRLHLAFATFMTPGDIGSGDIDVSLAAERRDMKGEIVTYHLRATSIGPEYGDACDVALAETPKR